MPRIKMSMIYQQFREGLVSQYSLFSLPEDFSHHFLSTLGFSAVTFSAVAAVLLRCSGDFLSSSDPVTSHFIVGQILGVVVLEDGFCSSMTMLLWLHGSFCSVEVLTYFVVLQSKSGEGCSEFGVGWGGDSADLAFGSPTFSAAHVGSQACFMFIDSSSGRLFQSSGVWSFVVFMVPHVSRSLK
ncbi:hypothetical protein Bca4012_100148 [Brassica carinata]